jgi:hypothetical protein
MATPQDIPPRRHTLPFVLRVFFVIVGLGSALVAFLAINAGKIEVVTRRGVHKSLVESEDPIRFWFAVILLLLGVVASFGLAFEKGRREA